MDFPNGLSKNMQYIAQIEAERRAAGAKGYGSYVAENDLSHMCVRQKKRDGDVQVCERCGRDFKPSPGDSEKYCEECLKIIITARKKKKTKAKPTKCSRCGAPIMRVRIRPNSICPTCLREKRRKIYDENNGRNEV